MGVSCLLFNQFETRCGAFRFLSIYFKIRGYLAEHVEKVDRVIIESHTMHTTTTCLLLLTVKTSCPHFLTTSQLITVVAAESSPYKTAHIVMMCVAFLILLPLAAFIAHFAKLYKKK